MIDDIVWKIFVDYDATRGVILLVGVNTSWVCMVGEPNRFEVFRHLSLCCIGSKDSERLRPIECRSLDATITGTSQVSGPRDSKDGIPGLLFF